MGNRVENPAAADGRVFDRGGKLAVQNLRHALAELLATVKADPSQPQEISRRFGLDKTLTWRIARVVREQDAWESVPHIPRRPSMQSFLRAMTKHGAPEGSVQTVREALDEFEEFIRTHTGDRETLEAMLGTGATRSGVKRMETFRKQAFQANSAIFGVRARVQSAVRFMTPSERPGWLNTSVMNSLVDFRRLRSDVSWGIAKLQEWDMPKGRERTAESNTAPLDPEAAEAFPLIPRFCSHPLPAIRSTNISDTEVRLEIAEGPVGNTAAATLVLGWRWLEPVPMHESAPGEMGQHGVHVFTPCETAIYDLFIHRSLTFAFDLKPRLVSQLPNGTSVRHASGQDLPVMEEIVDLGEGPPDLTTVEVPRFREIVELGARGTGHSLDDFRCFRLKLKYPPIPTLMLLEHPLVKEKQMGQI